MFQTIMEQQRVIRRLFRKAFRPIKVDKLGGKERDSKGEESPNNSDTEENDTVTEEILLC